MILFLYNYLAINIDNYIGENDMTSKTIKRMLDACYQAKRARGNAAAPPKGVLLRSTFSIWR